VILARPACLCAAAVHLFERCLAPRDEDDDVGPASVHSIRLGLRPPLIHVNTEALACQEHGCGGACRASAHHHSLLASIQGHHLRLWGCFSSHSTAAMRDNRACPVTQGRHCMDLELPRLWSSSVYTWRKAGHSNIHAQDCTHLAKRWLLRQCAPQFNAIVLVGCACASSSLDAVATCCSRWWSSSSDAAPRCGPSRTEPGRDA
jgi:hypothetical protein